MATLSCFHFFDNFLFLRRRKKNNSVEEILNQIDLQWFAAEDEGRTEDPSEFKLRKSREEGRVAKSQEFTGAIVMLLSVITLIAIAPWLFTNFITIIRFYFERAMSADLLDGQLSSTFYIYFIKMFLPISIVATLSSIIANIIQNQGFLFSTKPISPKFSKILPKFSEYLKKTLFSFEGGFNVVKSIGKVIIIVIVAYTLIKTELPQLLTLLNVNMWSAFAYVASLGGRLLLISAGIFIAVSIPDYLVQRRQFIESLKMTKQEVKEEYKMLEGDPLVKSRLRQRMRELLSQNIPQSVAKADVVITNPTHFACVIEYDKNVMPGPMLTAKGADALAQRIKELARESNVPIIENKPLARAIFAEVEVGDIIPEIYYEALALILSQVYNISTKSRNKWL
ncbi:MAG: flagellar biosynthesis protein FlhB [Treponemataceae bacterium]